MLFEGNLCQYFIGTILQLVILQEGGGMEVLPLPSGYAYAHIEVVYIDVITL